MSITEVLDEREKAYGDFGELAKYVQGFKSVLRASPSWPKMTAVQREAMEMVILKQYRLTHGDALHFDTWRDIAGYAALAAEEFHPREDKQPLKPADNPTTPVELEDAVK